MTLKDNKIDLQSSEGTKYFYKEKDVKEAVLEFEKEIDKKFGGEYPYGEICDLIQKIFGDFSKDTTMQRCSKCNTKLTRVYFSEGNHEEEHMVCPKCSYN